MGPVPIGSETGSHFFRPETDRIISQAPSRRRLQNHEVRWPPRLTLSLQAWLTVFLLNSCRSCTIRPTSQGRAPECKKRAICPVLAPAGLIACLAVR